MPNTLRPGDIVFATMLDAQEQNSKTRPVVVISTTDTPDLFLVVAVTSTFSTSDLSPSQVNLPWSPDKPTCHTGLKKPSRADVDWFIKMELNYAEKIGFVKPILFARIKNLFIERMKKRSNLD